MKRLLSILLSSCWLCGAAFAGDIVLWNGTNFYVVGGGATSVLSGASAQTYIPADVFHGADGWAQSISYGGAWIVLLSDTDASLGGTWVVRESGTYQVALSVQTTAVQASKTMSGVTYMYTNALNSATSAVWNVYSAAEWDILLPPYADQWTNAVFTNTITVEAGTRLGVYWAKNDNAGGASGSVLTHYLMLIRQ